MTAVAAGPPDAAAAAWRRRLATGDSLEVYSASASEWLPARVKNTSDGRVKVEYIVVGERCDKALLRTSPHLRPAAEAGVQRLWTAEPQHVTPRSGRPPVQVPLACGQERWLDFSQLELGEVIGAGGFGTVFRALLRPVATGGAGAGAGGPEAVAVKRLVLSGGPEALATQLEEFSKEVVVLQALDHPRLVRFVGVAYEAPQHLCIVTELAPGGSLHDLIHLRRGGAAAAAAPPPPALATEAAQVRLMCEIAEGVSFLHSRKPPFVHRDLKSANVVLDAQGSAKLCDFGLTESMERTHISRREAEGGSPRYMAPEIFDARRRITEKIDIWSLGCLIGEISTGLVPHEECSTVHQVATKLLLRQEGPFDNWASVSVEAVRELGERCCHLQAAERPGAEAVLEGLRGAAAAVAAGAK